MGGMFSFESEEDSGSGRATYEVADSYHIEVSARDSRERKQGGEQRFIHQSELTYKGERKKGRRSPAENAYEDTVDAAEVAKLRIAIFRPPLSVEKDEADCLEFTVLHLFRLPCSIGRILLNLLRRR